MSGNRNRRWKANKLGICFYLALFTEVAVCAEKTPEASLVRIPQADLFKYVNQTLHLPLESLELYEETGDAVQPTGGLQLPMSMPDGHRGAFRTRQFVVRTNDNFTPVLHLRFSLDGTVVNSRSPAEDLLTWFRDAPSESAWTGTTKTPRSEIPVQVSNERDLSYAFEATFPFSQVSEVIARFYFEDHTRLLEISMPLALAGSEGPEPDSPDESLNIIRVKSPHRKYVSLLENDRKALLAGIYGLGSLLYEQVHSQTLNKNISPDSLAAEILAQRRKELGGDPSPPRLMDFVGHLIVTREGEKSAPAKAEAPSDHPGTSGAMPSAVSAPHIPTTKEPIEQKASMGPLLVGAGIAALFIGGIFLIRRRHI